MTRRWPALVLIPVLLVGALLFDQRGASEQQRRERLADVSGGNASGDLAQFMPVAAPADALSSVWYSAGGTAEPNGMANQAVVISNPTDKTVRGTVTAVPSVGHQVVQAVVLGKYSRTRVNIFDMVKAPFASAEIEFEGGEVAVEHEVAGPDGISAAPCASAAASTWYFASGATTTPNADETLVLFNPFPDPATVNITFATPQGERSPDDLQGFAVPGRSVVAEPINPEAAVDQQVSTSVVAVAGRIVVDRLQTYDGQAPSPGSGATPSGATPSRGDEPMGLTVSLGVPHPAATWMFPVGVKQDGIDEQFVIYDPGSQDAAVAVAISLVDPAVNGQVDPITVNVAAGSYQVVDLDQQDRVPTRVDHSTVVVSTNHVPVVVDRLLFSGKPYPAQGTASSSGTSLVAPQWLFASGGNVPNKLSERISVQNPSNHSVTVRAEVIADGHIGLVPGVAPITLGPHGHDVIRFSDHLNNRVVSVLIVASAPIAAERLLYRLNTQGMSTAVGIPLATGLARAGPSAFGS